MFEKQDYSNLLEEQYPTLIKAIFGDGKLNAEILDILPGGTRKVKFTYSRNF